VLGRRGAIALACAAALVMPAAALANAYDDTLKEYQSTGAVDGCKYTAAELSQAKDQTPANIKDVAPGYPAQLALAASKRAKGCSKAEEKASSAAGAPAGTDTGSGTGSGATTQAPAGTDTGATTQPPATTTVAPNAPQTAATPAPAPATTPAAASSSSHRGARLALLVLAALVVILLALWAAARWWAWEPHWLVRWRHATAEAGWRASAAWAEFTDWLRLGR
jgi:cobalamin biosynthesis Mg chelatase CobN